MLITHNQFKKLFDRALQFIVSFSLQGVILLLEISLQNVTFATHDQLIKRWELVSSNLESNRGHVKSLPRWRSFGLEITRAITP